MGGAGGSEIEYGKGNLSLALATTSKLMTSGAQEPIFEATLEHEGVLVREDVLLPTGGASWRIVRSGRRAFTENSRGGTLHQTIRVSVHGVLLAQ